MPEKTITLALSGMFEHKNSAARNLSCRGRFNGWAARKKGWETGRVSDPNQEKPQLLQWLGCLGMLGIFLVAVAALSQSVILVLGD
jgi:hypothetical protein